MQPEALSIYTREALNPGGRCWSDVTGVTLSNVAIWDTHAILVPERKHRGLPQVRYVGVLQLLDMGRLHGEI